jgi:4-hydroxyproline epimerase
MSLPIRIVDTHTGGEPTRVVIEGGPDLGTGSAAERREKFRAGFDHYRAAIVNEPRGSDVMVGALLTEPRDPSCVAGVIFFNNVGYLGMCGHGTIGVAVALGHLGRIAAGRHRLETPVGIVTIQYDGKNRVSFDNVPSYRFCEQACVDVPECGKVVGDIAWGGNWFFLTECRELNQGRRTPLRLRASQIAELTSVTQTLREALRRQGKTGANGAVIDHVELCGPPEDSSNHGRNFVLCPGGAYDRSPCGTGTSAKLACLAAAGKLQPGALWRQESILGSVFEAWYRWNDDGSAIIPTVCGTAYVTAEATLYLDFDDPFCWGIRIPDA